MKNITTTTKTILFASLIAAMILPFSVMDFAQAIEKNQTIGKNIIVYPKEKVQSPDLIRMNEIVNQLDNSSLSESAKEILYDEAREIRERAISQYVVDPILSEKAIVAKKITAQVQNNNPQIGEIGKFRDIVNAIGRGGGNDYTLYVDPAYFNESNLKTLADHMRQHIGNEIDITFKQVGKTISTACSSGQTAECNPVEAGVQFEREDSSLIRCTIGMQADYNSGTEGFITAGHCGSTASSVDEWYQPTKDLFGFNKVGEMTIDGYADETTCDCAFIDANESITDKIYSNILPDQIGTITMNDFMTVKGWNSTSFTGQIDDVDIDISYDGGVTDIREQFRVDEPSKKGDSGGPTYESGAQFPDLMGMNVAKDSANTVSYHSRASYVDDELEDVVLDFD